MRQGRIGRGLRMVALAGIFGAGYLCGSLGQRSAEAQLGDVMKKAGEQGGALGSAAQLGSSIVEMQQHVDGLNKDLETLRKVKTALGGCGAAGRRRRVGPGLPRSVVAWRRLCVPPGLPLPTGA